jgi:hypothetical protein
MTMMRKMENYTRVLEVKSPFLVKKSSPDHSVKTKLSSPASRLVPRGVSYNFLFGPNLFLRSVARTPRCPSSTSLVRLVPFLLLLAQLFVKSKIQCKALLVVSFLS